MRAWTDTLAAAQCKRLPPEVRGPPRTRRPRAQPLLAVAPGALWSEAGGGRVAAAGSAEMFSDAWLASEGNGALLAWLLAWLQPARSLGPCMRRSSAAHELWPPWAPDPAHACPGPASYQGLLPWGCFGLPASLGPHLLPGVRSQSPGPVPMLRPRAHPCSLPPWSKPAPR